MSLRARLVLVLLALLAAGMAVYGFASYQAFQRSELARLDDQVRATMPAAERQLRVLTDGIDAVGPGGPRGPGQIGRPGGQGGGPGGVGRGDPVVVVAPGTYAELRDADGTPLEPSIAFEVDEVARPDLSDLDVPADDTLWTAPSVEGEVAWRVAADTLDDGRTLIVAVPTTSLDDALARLLVIELVTGGALLVALGIGAWLVVRSGLRPLERMASTAGSITAGSLDQRVATPTTGLEVQQLATALNTMLDELEHAFREREATEAKLRRFLSDASHELRTPLTSIQGYAELFRLGADGEHDDLDVIMRRIEDESGRMRELVEDLLALARLDDATSEPVREVVDLAVLAADACSDAAAVAPDRQIVLDAPAPTEVTGTPAQLRQAIGNLVTNALRHTPEDAAIEVSVHDQGDHAEVVVRDHGQGLDAEGLQRAFDRFWQADPSRSGVGAGLGLSIVHAIAEAHGGAVSVHNAPDGGAVFTLAVPRDAPDGTSPAPRDEPALDTAAHDGGGRRA